MRVLLITEELAVGGAERMTVNLACGLLNSEIPVAIAAANGEIAANIPSSVKLFLLARPSAFNFITIVCGLARAIRSFRPSLIHSQSATYALIVSSLSRFMRIPCQIVLTHHSMNTTRLGPLTSGFLINHCCDRVIALSKEKERKFLAWGVEQSKIRRVPNFVSVSDLTSQAAQESNQQIRSKYNIAPNIAIVSMVGRLIPSKRFDLGFAALAEAEKQLGVPIVCLVVGDGPEYSRLNSISQNLARTGATIFVGNVSRTAPFIACSNLLLAPTSLEVQSVSILESLALGIPIVCSDIEANREIVRHEVDGLVVKDDELGQALGRLLGSPELGQQFSKNAKDAARYFDTPAVIKDLTQIYEEML